jgi:pyruvate dehydrogenase E1 component
MGEVRDREGPDAFQAFLDRSRSSRRAGGATATMWQRPCPIALATDREISTQGVRQDPRRPVQDDSELAERIVTTSPDVTGTTNLGPWVNRRKLFAREARADTFKTHNIPSTAKWEFTPDGQHIELGIAEMNLFLLLGAAGLSHSLFGKRLIPIGTVYDPFVARGLDALNYACYQDARFMIVGTPSGVTLAPEGGAHQSIGSPLIGMSQDGLAAFEPAFADELAVIMEWAFDYMQRDGEGDPDERTWLRDETGGSVYLRLTTNPIEQPGKRPTRISARARSTAPTGCGTRAELRVVIAYQGVVAPEAIRAAGPHRRTRRDVGVLAVTSADRLNAGWTAAQRARARGNPSANSHIETLTAGPFRPTASRHACIGSVHAFRHRRRSMASPATLAPGHGSAQPVKAGSSGSTGRDGGRGAGARPGRWRSASSLSISARPAPLLDRRSLPPSRAAG